MVEQVIWHGTEAERDELLASLARQCLCTYAPSGARMTCCPGHDALVHDQLWLDRLCFMRTLRAQLNLEEEVP